MASSSSIFSNLKKLEQSSDTLLQNQSSNGPETRSVNTLVEIILNSIFEQCDFNVEHIAAFLSDQEDNGFETALQKYSVPIKTLIDKVNTLCSYVANADLNSTKNFLEKNKNLLPLLFKLRTTVKSQYGHVYENCNALQILIKSGDVGRSGCELYLMADETPQDSTRDKLFLYRNNDSPNFPFYYCINGETYRIEKGFCQKELYESYVNTLNTMYRDELMNQGLSLDSETLSENEIAAYAAIIKITSLNGHTEYVKQNAMLEMIKNNYFKNNESEFAYFSQMSAITLEQVEIRKILDKAAFETLCKAILEFPYSEHERNLDYHYIGKWYEDLASLEALKTFKAYLENRLKSPATTFDVDIDLLLTAFQFLGEFNSKDKDDYERKRNVIFNDVIGPIQHIQSIVSQMSMAQGVFFFNNFGVPFKRHLHLRSDSTKSINSFFSESSGWIDEYGKPEFTANVWYTELPFFFQQKQVELENKMADTQTAYKANLS